MNTVKLDRFVRFQLNEYHPDYHHLRKKFDDHLKEDEYYHMTFWQFLNEMHPHMQGGLSTVKRNEIISHE